MSETEDMTDAAYVASSGAVVSSETQATYDGTADGQVGQTVTIVDEGGGALSRKFVFRVSVRKISGTISSDASLQIRLQGDAVTPGVGNIGSEVTGSVQVFSVEAETDAAGTSLSAAIRWDDSGVLEITKWQVEEVTGQAIQTPSEYVSNGVLASPYHGAGIDGVKNFNYANGNTVSSNVVTEGVGALFDATDSGNDAEGPHGYHSDITAQNIALQSEDFSTTWAPNLNAAVNTNVQTSPSGKVDADRLIDDSGGGNGSVTFTQVVSGLATSTQYTYSVFVEKDQLDWVQLAFENNGVQSITSYFDLTNGVIGTSGAGNDSQEIRLLRGNIYRCSITFTVDSVDDSADMRIRVAEANNDNNVDLDGTSSIFAWGAQLEVGSFASTYIATTTTAVTRTGDLLTYPAAGNIRDLAGTCKCDMSLDGPVDDTRAAVATDSGLLTYVNGADTRILIALGGGSSVSPSTTTMIDTPQTVAATWGAAGLIAYSPTTLGPDLTPGTYGGTIGSGDIGVGVRNNGLAHLQGCVRKLKIYQTQLTDAQVAA
ncbi:MAG: hypothetical protein V3W52_17260 [Syntrophobacteria bacterium]